MPTSLPFVRYLGALLVAAVTAIGCGSDEATNPAPAPDGRASDGPTFEDPGPIHVHGLGVNPKDGALFVATHTGLFRAPEGEVTATRVADRYQDTMGFTVVGPDRFLGSGPPDAREKLPPYLGLVSSENAGKRWEEVSLMGKVDFHVLEASGRHVYGFGSKYDARQPTFLVSADGGRQWDERSPPGLLMSLAIDPDDPERIVAAAEGGRGPAGLYGSTDAGRRWRLLSDELGLVAYTASRSLFLADADGVIRASADGGRSWDEVGDIEGQPAAFEAAGETLLAGLHDGTIKRSDDGGRNWTVRSEPEATTTGG